MRGADWKGTRSERSASAGATTAAGTWAASEAEAAYIAESVDADEAWEATLAGAAEWTNRPVQPPGLARSGVMEMAVNMVEARRRKQAAAAAGAGASSTVAAPAPAAALKQEAAV